MFRPKIVPKRFDFRTLPWLARAAFDTFNRKHFDLRLSFVDLGDHLG
jgi:hypothetical protein